MGNPILPSSDANPLASTSTFTSSSLNSSSNGSKLSFFSTSTSLHSSLPSSLFNLPPFLSWALFRCFPCLLFLVSSLYAIFYLSSLLPNSDSAPSSSSSSSSSSFSSLNFKIQSFQDIQSLAKSLRSYSNTSFTLVFSLYALVYIFKQCFCLPGTAALNLIGGALYGPLGFWIALLFTAIGVSGCYCISYLCFAPWLQRFKKIQTLSQRVQQAENKLILLIFLRIFPFTPQWFINVAAPCFNLSFPLYLFTALVGLAPYTYMTTQAGVWVTDIHQMQDLITPKRILQLIGMAMTVWIPVFIKWRFPAHWKPWTQRSHLDKFE
ncbi:Transmembrane protein 41A [Coelomomyces lativittatus]|nr:Transmembrane protein 41A [Coelomomyces lativittatus]